MEPKADHERGAARRFTVAEVLAMVDAGILDDDERLELLDGALVPMSPQGPAHSGVAVVVRLALEAAFGAGFHVRPHSPLQAGASDLPEPDLAVVRGDPSAYLERLPQGVEAVLVVEIAQSSQRRDRGKASIYAAAGVSTYWLLDLAARRLEVRTEPGSSYYAR